MRTSLGDDLQALQSAAADCGLEFCQGVAAFVFRDLDLEDLLPLAGIPPVCHHVLRPRLRRQPPPHEVGVWVRTDGRVELCWDDSKDGFGLAGLVGPAGSRLRTAYNLTALTNVARRLGLMPGPVDVDYDGVVLLEFHDMTRKIIARIDPKGSATFKVEGVTGQSCQTVTAPFEKAVGIVTHDVETEDMHKVAQQTVETGQGG